jgi:hypothetical protein
VERRRQRQMCIRDSTWCPGAKVGEIINSPINPVLYST